jgi:hypothetical protein
MLKRCRVVFDPLTEYFQHKHLWVLMPSLPLHFWNEGSIQAIENSLGSFITVDNPSLSAKLQKLGKILVAMDIHSGLPEVLEIERRGRSIRQCLDYLGLPYRCSFYRSIGHLRRDCKGHAVEEDDTKDFSLHQPSPYLSSGVDYIGLSSFHFP